jgi:hypothetical protein
MHAQEAHKGSGFVIEGERIITNFHVIQAPAPPTAPRLDSPHPARY